MVVTYLPVSIRLVIPTRGVCSVQVDLTIKNKHNLLLLTLSGNRAVKAPLPEQSLFEGLRWGGLVGVLSKTNKGQEAASIVLELIGIIQNWLDLPLNGAHA